MGGDKILKSFRNAGLLAHVAAFSQKDITFKLATACDGTRDFPCACNDWASFFKLPESA